MKPNALLTAIVLALGITIASASAGAATHDGKRQDSASLRRAITQHTIGGGRLGLHQGAYVRMFGRPRVGMLGKEDLSLLGYRELSLSVLLDKGIGVAINTFDRTFRTSAGVGPCSPHKDLLDAYGKRLKRLTPTGPLMLYRLGNLVFRVDRSLGKVGSVTLGRGDLSLLIAANSFDCGTP